MQMNLFCWLIDGELNDSSGWILLTGDETIKDYNKQQSRSHRVKNIMIHKDYETASKKNNIGITCFSFEKTSFFQSFLKYCSIFLSLRYTNVGSWLNLP